MQNSRGIVGQAAGRGRRLTFPPEKYPPFSKAILIVLILEYADGLHSLWRGAFAEGWAIRRPYESAVQMFEMWKDNDRGDQATRGLHGGHVTASLVCKGERHEFKSEFAAARSGTAAA